MQNVTGRLPLIVATLVLLGVASNSAAQASRDFVSVVGSSTVYPFATSVAEQLGRTQPKFKTPKVEATGTGGGIKLFCDGIGVRFPDIATASRRIKQSELDICAKNGVREIIEIKIGFDGIVVANAKAARVFKVSRKALWLALAKQVPDPKGKPQLIANPYRSWNQIDASLPKDKIEVLGPPPTSGTRDAFAELVLEGGCSSVPWIAAIKKTDEKRFKAICHAIREDGAYVEAGENDNLIVQKLGANPKALGVFGYSFLEQNPDKLHGSIIDAVAPTYERIADGKYPGARPLYLYAKKSHIAVIRGMQEYLSEFVSNRAASEDGYLINKGLVALPAAERAQIQTAVRVRKVMPAKI